MRHLVNKAVKSDLVCHLNGYDMIVYKGGNKLFCGTLYKDSKRLYDSIGESKADVLQELKNQIKEITESEKFDAVIKEERSKVADEIVSEMKNRYLHKVGDQFDNAIYELEKIANAIKNE